MSSAIREVFFADYAFQIWKNVYEPAEDSFLLADNLVVKNSANALDVGTGCGILGIIAASKAATVIGVDTNPFAVRCAKANAKLNQVADRISFVQGNLYGPITASERFDLIIFNAPYLPSELEESGSLLKSAWDGGITGRQVIDRFIVESSGFLKRRGQILLMQSTLTDVDETIRKFGESGLETTIVAEKNLPFFEKLILIRAEHRGH